jgi:eukaryotic-like serine/threonine-protein kinase
METTLSKVGRYEIVDELGRGGMGVVYRANDPIIGRIVALKTVRLSSEGAGISHAELLERFQNEARAAGRLTHPNIVVVYDAGEDHGLYYITMELIDGKSLQAVLENGRKLTIQRIVPIIEQVCSALEFAHRRGVVHRDIKPANIMLNREDHVKITDFGTAKILQYGTQQKTNAIGTPGYMSPEQIKGRGIDGRSDIFALGVMLYEMTTGQRPFQGEDVASVLYKILNQEPPPPHKVEPSIPPGVSSTIMKALSKNPHMRYESCAELIDDLQNYRPGGVAPKPRSTSEPERPAGAPPLVPREPKNLKAEMPKIPGLEARPSVPPAKGAPPKDTSRGASGEAASQPEEPERILGLYEGPPTKKASSGGGSKKLVGWGVGLLALYLVGNFAVKRFMSPDSGAGSAGSTAQSDGSSADANGVTSGNLPRASRTSPDIATTGELAAPWSSKEFLYKSLSGSKYVPALIIRLPGTASSSNSYWAFSLEAPFTNCKLEYVPEPAKLADYGVFTKHPMVVNPCSRTVFDPLQMKELPGGILVRGAILQGYDPRPPYGIELKVVGNRILAVAME